MRQVLLYICDTIFNEISIDETPSVLLSVSSLRVICMIAVTI